MPERNIYDGMSALDFRYYDPDVAGFLSEEAFIWAKCQVEIALVRAFVRVGMCDQAVLDEVVAACREIRAEEVYAEEGTTRHDIRALVNCIQRRVSERARPFVHMMATSYDIVDTANAYRWTRVMEEVILPALLDFERVLIQLAIREAATPQIGRTHGQHAVPITFGFFLANFVHRFGESIECLRERTHALRGKFSGAVGAYNASSLFFPDPVIFEREVLSSLGLKPSGISTQIVPPEPMLRLVQELGNMAGIMANLVRDLRNLQRTEIGEAGESFGARQVGSSTMAQKQNPITFENIESDWKIVYGYVIGHLVTAMLDQISDHQRDLTNSASSRTYVEIVGYIAYMVKRLTKALAKLQVHREHCEANLRLSGDLILAEPLYLLLASLGHPNAHEAVRLLALKARTEGRSMYELASEDTELRPYLDRLSDDQTEILMGTRPYDGLATLKTERVARSWAERFSIEIEEHRNS